jgi:predicted transcriptional regulator
VKSTHQERLDNKERRRFKRLDNLIDKIGMKMSKSERSIKIVDEVLAKLADQGHIKQIVETLRRAN